MRLAYRRARVLTWGTLAYVTGLLALGCYVNAGPLDPARLYWGLAGFGAACLVGPALGMAWQRLDRSA